MPTAATNTYTIDRLDPYANAERATLIHIGLAQGTYAKGTVLGELTATAGRYAAYNNAAVDGTETAKGILQYACTVDASNNITIANENNVTRKSAPMYAFGSGVWFKSEDLTGMNAAGLTDAGGSIIAGNLTTGILSL